jgi:hypothetical protein
MKHLRLSLIVFLLLSIVSHPCGATTDCDYAQVVFFWGSMGPEGKRLQRYMKAIELCPGFIRPHELIGNYYRKQGNNGQAIDYFKKAAELGSVNYKLYYLLGLLYYQQNEYSQALYYVKKSLNLNESYQKAIELKIKLDQIKDTEKPLLTLFEPVPDQLNRVAHFYKALTFRGHAKDQSDIKVLRINGFNVNVSADGKFLADIPLKPGLNRIKIECLDSIGNRMIEEVRVHRAATIADTAIYRKSYAVIIGINDYDKWPKLDSAVFDATAVQSLLLANGFQEAKLILNKEATQRRILTELYSELPPKVERDDRILFYFAGHGATTKAYGKFSTGYIIPVESGLSDFPTTAISMGQIRDICSRISAKHIIFVMDCCYAGQILEQGLKNQQDGDSEIEGSAYKRVIQIITAGAKDQVALEGEKHGLFTEFFLQSLEGNADLNSDKVVTGREMGNYIPPIVARLTNHTQTPMFAHIEGNGDILFFLEQNDM